MLIWQGEMTGEAAPALLFDSSMGPRSIAQFRALVALSVGGINREELDELAAVSNGPALIQSLDSQGYRVGSRRRPAAWPLIWSGRHWRGSSDAGYRQHQCYQYALTPLGVRVMEELMRPDRFFRHRWFGYVSYYHALCDHGQLFAHASKLFRNLLRRNGHWAFLGGEA